MKNLILPLLAIMALFVSCSDDSEGTQPYDNTFYGNLIYNAAIVASDAKCDVSIVDNVATVTLYAVKFAPPSISSKTKEGRIEDGTVELQFSVRELSTGEIFRFVDTDSDEAVEGIEETWFTQVQM